MPTDPAKTVGEPSLDEIDQALRGAEHALHAVGSARKGGHAPGGAKDRQGIKDQGSYTALGLLLCVIGYISILVGIDFVRADVSGGLAKGSIYTFSIPLLLSIAIAFFVFNSGGVELGIGKYIASRPANFVAKLLLALLAAVLTTLCVSEVFQTLGRIAQPASTVANTSIGSEKTIAGGVLLILAGIICPRFTTASSGVVKSYSTMILSLCGLFLSVDGGAAHTDAVAQNKRTDDLKRYIGTRDDDIMKSKDQVIGRQADLLSAQQQQLTVLLNKYADVSKAIEAYTQSSAQTARNSEALARDYNAAYREKLSTDSRVEKDLSTLGSTLKAAASKAQLFMGHHDFNASAFLKAECSKNGELIEKNNAELTELRSTLADIRLRQARPFYIRYMDHVGHWLGSDQPTIKTNSDGTFLLTKTHIAERIAALKAQDDVLQSQVDTCPQYQSGAASDGQ